MRLRSVVVFLAVLAMVCAGTWEPLPAGRVAAAPSRTMGYGMLANDFGAVASMGFNWTKVLASWKDIEPSRGVYSFGALDSVINSARGYGLSVLVNVGHSPTWATGSSNDTTPPSNDNDLADFMGALASHFQGRISAYEIWNEPNLRIEWGDRQPSTADYPVKYASMLRALYPRVKAADPNALVVTGGLSTAGDGMGYWSYGDLLWIRDLYLSGNVKSCSDGQGGLRSCFDALGSHPYGGPYSPETPASVAQYDVGMYFRRAEQHKQMMDVHGLDFDRGVWVTEFNWLLDPGAFGVTCSWGGTWDRYKLSGSGAQQEATQADYLVRAFNYAYANWSWMQGMIVFNLDFMGSGSCDQVRWYSLTRPDGTRRPAFTALTNVAKPGIPLPALRLNGNEATFLLEPSAPNTASKIFQITNGGSGTLTWTAQTDSPAWIGLSSPSGTAPASLTITVNKSGLSSGWHTGTVTISGAPGTQDSPQQIAVRLYVGTLQKVQGLGVRKTAN